MRLARAQLPSGAIAYGRIVDQQFIPLDGSPFEQALEGLRPAGRPLVLSAVRLLAPCQPSKVICVGRNYVQHAAEHGAEVPAEPLLFLKPPSAVIGPGDEVVLPPLSQQVEHEAELVVVIGRRARHMLPGEADEVILGYTCGNDVTARDLQRMDGQWTRAKGFDTFCPLGPWIDTAIDWRSQTVECQVNQIVRQSAGAGSMVFGVPRLLAFISAVMTLEPGDVVMTGTPSGVSPLRAGDSVAVVVSGIGTLENPVRSRERP